MSLPCPCCRAANDAGPACRRCRADLSLLFALRDQRERLLARAADALTQGDGPAALKLAGEAAAIRDGDDARTVRAAAALLTRDFAAAWAWYSATATRQASSPAGR
jgi:methylphosphotriester-DNA--protein-cysteine methyltransferase